MRDMVPNHLFRIIKLRQWSRSVEAEAAREQAKILRAIQQIARRTCARTVRGQLGRVRSRGNGRAIAKKRKCADSGRNFCRAQDLHRKRALGGRTFTEYGRGCERVNEIASGRQARHAVPQTTHQGSRIGGAGLQPDEGSRSASVPGAGAGCASGSGDWTLVRDIRRHARNRCERCSMTACG